ncbi:hypothetical protein MELB17_10983 [Marinobacter sp. ELB17]|nr:hypothetical protein MELB17_10983 [Marinobacter sp. ELB17]
MARADNPATMSGIGLHPSDMHLTGRDQSTL